MGVCVHRRERRCKTMPNRDTNDRPSARRQFICIDAQVITSNDSFTALVSNISGNGLEIQAPLNIAPKTAVLISIMLAESFVFRGVVVWTLCDFINKQWVYRIGVQTDSISFRDMVVTKLTEKNDLVQRISPQIEAKSAVFSNHIKHCA